MPEIILKEEKSKAFSEIYPFELFQPTDSEGIWTKVTGTPPFKGGACRDRPAAVNQKYAL